MKGNHFFARFGGIVKQTKLDLINKNGTKNQQEQDNHRSESGILPTRLQRTTNQLSDKYTPLPEETMTVSAVVM